MTMTQLLNKLARVSAQMSEWSANLTKQKASSFGPVLSSRLDLVRRRWDARLAAQLAGAYGRAPTAPLVCLFNCARVWAAQTGCGRADAGAPLFAPYRWARPPAAKKARKKAAAYMGARAFFGLARAL